MPLSFPPPTPTTFHPNALTDSRTHKTSTGLLSPFPQTFFTRTFPQTFFTRFTLVVECVTRTHSIAIIVDDETVAGVNKVLQYCTHDPPPRQAIHSSQSSTTSPLLTPVHHPVRKTEYVRSIPLVAASCCCHLPPCCSSWEPRVTRDGMNKSSSPRAARFQMSAPEHPM